MPDRPASENVVIQSPTSFVGATRRIWKITHAGAWMVPLAVVLVAFAWFFIVAWYLLFGVLVIPWRLLRRGQRRRKQEAMRHRELLSR